jgi:hypothetical protein
MTLLDRLEKKCHRFAVPNVTLYLIVGQVAFYLGVMSQWIHLDAMLLIPARVLEGEVWRLFSFLFIPPTTNLLFALFGWYFFYLMGTALENQWGVFRYNLYLLIACLSTILFSFLTPGYPAANGFIGGSVFLAFAFLYPEFQLLLYFILPIRIKWLALATWIGYFLVFAFGNWSLRFMVLASVCNFLLFFWRDIIGKVRYGHRKMAYQVAGIAAKDEPLHRCVACGATEKTHRGLEFRYCGDCRPVACYCINHLPGHTHIQTLNLRHGG